MLKIFLAVSMFPFLVTGIIIGFVWTTFCAGFWFIQTWLEKTLNVKHEIQKDKINHV